MSTVTLLAVEAVPSQPLISVALVTAAPASGMDTREVLATASQVPGSGSGSPPPVPVNSSRFAEPAAPAPAGVFLAGVALPVSPVPAPAGAASGWSARYSAAAPATCGVAID